MSISKVGGMQITKSTHTSLLSGWSKSTCRGCAPSDYSKPYVFFSTTDATLAAIDFSKKSVDDGVVDSPPNRGLYRSPIVLASPLKGSPCVPHRGRSPSQTGGPLRMPYR